MKKKEMREILEQIASKNIIEQKSLLENHFNEWKGNSDQVDDVMVIGLRF